MTKDKLYPTPPPKPTVSFGILPKPNFPENSTNTNLKYSLDTVSGNLPQLPDQLKVYNVQKPIPDLIAFQTISSRLSAGGFEKNWTKLSDSVYSWVNDSTNLPEKIAVNIYTKNFRLSSDLASSSALSSQGFSDEQQAANTSQDFLVSLGYDLNDLNLSLTQAKLLFLQNNNLVEATSLSNTQFILVNFIQNNIDNLPIFYAKPNTSNINFLVGIEDGKPQVIQGTFFLQKPSDQSSTYPLVSSAKAYEELQNGRAYIASYYGNGNSVSIKNVYLAYYISPNDQDYIAPIIVFEGDNGFFAYVNAITDEWTSK